MLCADLKVMSGRHQGKIISLTTKKFLVGRGEDCHLRPNNDLVSRHHCVFSLDDYSVRLRDLGSTNGTFVNNEQLRGQVELKTGDQVRIGKLELEVTIKEGAPVAVGAPEEPYADPVAEESSEEIPQYEETVMDDGSGTVYEIPGSTPGLYDTSMLAEGDTGYYQNPQMQQPLQYAPGAFPPGYGYPPQGYPPQGYYPPGMPPGQYMYPYGNMPQYPQYPQYPMQQPMMPQGYPQQQYPQNMQNFQAPPQEAPAESGKAAKAEKDLQMKLPDPEETGVKPPAAPAGGGETKKLDRTENPSQMAGDLIQQYMRRRPS